MLIVKVLGAVLAILVLLSPLLGNLLLKNGKSPRIRRIGWDILYVIDLVGHAGATDSVTEEYDPPDRGFVARYGDRP